MAKANHGRTGNATFSVKEGAKGLERHSNFRGVPGEEPGSEGTALKSHH